MTKYTVIVKKDGQQFATIDVVVNSSADPNEFDWTSLGLTDVILLAKSNSMIERDIVHAIQQHENRTLVKHTSKNCSRVALRLVCNDCGYPASEARYLSESELPDVSDTL